MVILLLLRMVLLKLHSKRMTCPFSRHSIYYSLVIFASVVPAIFVRHSCLLSFVIPAKAGIQFFFVPQSAGGSRPTLLLTGYFCVCRSGYFRSSFLLTLFVIPAYFRSSFLRKQESSIFLFLKVLVGQDPPFYGPSQPLIFVLGQIPPWSTTFTRSCAGYSVEFYNTFTDCFLIL